MVQLCFLVCGQGRCQASRKGNEAHLHHRRNKLKRQKRRETTVVIGPCEYLAIYTGDWGWGGRYANLQKDAGQKEAVRIVNAIKMPRQGDSDCLLRRSKSQMLTVWTKCGRIKTGGWRSPSPSPHRYTARHGTVKWWTLCYNTLIERRDSLHHRGKCHATRCSADRSGSWGIIMISAFDSCPENVVGMNRTSLVFASHPYPWYPWYPWYPSNSSPSSCTTRLHVLYPRPPSQR